MGPGDHRRVPIGRIHRFEAIERTELVEVSTPELDDVIRLEDDFGRAGDQRALGQPALDGRVYRRSNDRHHRSIVQDRTAASTAPRSGAMEVQAHAQFAHRQGREGQSLCPRARSGFDRPAFTDVPGRQRHPQVSLLSGTWRCTCHYFDTWGSCVHLLTIHKMLGVMVPAEPDFLRLRTSPRPSRPDPGGHGAASQLTTARFAPRGSPNRAISCQPPAEARIRIAPGVAVLGRRPRAPARLPLGDGWAWRRDLAVGRRRRPAAASSGQPAGRAAPARTAAIDSDRGDGVRRQSRSSGADGPPDVRSGRSPGPASWSCG